MEQKTKEIIIGAAVLAFLILISFLISASPQSQNQASPAATSYENPQPTYVQNTYPPQTGFWRNSYDYYSHRSRNYNYKQNSQYYQNYRYYRNKMQDSIYPVYLQKPTPANLTSSGRLVIGDAYVVSGGKSWGYGLVYQS